MTKLKAWIQAARIRTLPLSLSGIIVGGAVAHDHEAFNLTIFILALATTIGFQVLSNFANDYGDGVKGTDNNDRVGPARALQGGLLTRKELKMGMVITTVLTLLIVSVLIFVSFGKDNFLLSIVFFNLGIVAIIAAITYTVGKNAYGYRALGDLFVFIFFGLVGVIGSYFLFNQSLNEFIILPAISIGLLSTAVLNLNNMRDRISDAKAQKITVAVLLGEKAVKLYHTLLILGAFISALIYYWFTGTYNWDLLPLFAFIPLFLNVIKVIRSKEASSLDPELKKVVLSTFLYSLLFFATNFF